MELEHNYTKEEWKEKVEQTKGVCPGYKCKSHFVGIENLTLDHIIAISKAEKGFIYSIDDVQPLCSKCNSRKGTYVVAITRQPKEEVPKVAEYME